MLDLARFNLIAGWTSMIAGAVSGAAIGLFFHREEWMGGYASLRRRMIRLGHIAFFGLAGRSLRLALLVAFEQRILFELGLDEGLELEVRHLQKLDRLLQLRRHDQGLALPQL